MQDIELAANSHSATSTDVRYTATGVALLDGFAEFYPEMAKRIANHLDDMRAFDKQVDDLNRRRPNGVPALSRSTPALAKDLRIPSPYKTGELWWPPPQPNLALQYLASMPPDPFLIQRSGQGHLHRGA